MADIIQLGAITAVVSCPLGPRVRYFVGRGDNKGTPPPDGLLPDPHGLAEEVIELFGRKSFSAGGLAALVGAHTVSQQFGFDQGRKGQGQDSTPGKWDGAYYNETLEGDGGDGVTKFPSDVALGRDERTKASFEFFGSVGGQVIWREVCCLFFLLNDRIQS